MGELLTDALPWPGQDSEEDAAAAENAASAETTPGGDEPTPWVVVGEGFNPAEAAIIKGRLESEGITALVQQEAMGILLGLTVGALGSAKILVPEPLAQQALDILADTFEEDEAEADE